MLVINLQQDSPQLFFQAFECSRCPHIKQLYQNKQVHFWAPICPKPINALLTQSAVRDSTDGDLNS